MVSLRKVTLCKLRTSVPVGLRLGILGLMSFLWSWYAEAQSLGAGTLKGTVADSTNGPIAAAEGELKNPITGFSRLARTENDGGFVVDNIPPQPESLYVSFV